MKHIKYILTILLILVFRPASAHQDFWLVKDFGNVKVKIRTGFKYEEINKVFIIGQLTEKLAIELGYKDQIFLDFNHHYTGFVEPDHFISFDNGATDTVQDHSYYNEPILSEKSIVVRQVAQQFNAKITLKLVEYAIRNLSEIKRNQTLIEYFKNYCHWRIQSLDSLQIKDIVKRPLSQEIINVMSTKIYRPEDAFSIGVTYNFNKGKFTLIKRYHTNTEIKIKTLDNIYDFQEVNGNSAFVFDTDSSFYFLSLNGDTPISKRHVIENRFENYRPYNIENIGDGKIAISFSYLLKDTISNKKERILIYLVENDKLIQDLDELIEKDK